MSKANVAKRGVCLLLPIMCMSIGCHHVSTRPAKPMRHPSQSPIERKDFRASVEETWAAALRAVEMSHGSIVMKDKDSRRIIYGIFDKRGRRQVELTVLLKDRTSRSGPEITAVFLGLRARRPEGYSIIADDFFEKLHRNLSRQQRSIKH